MLKRTILAISLGIASVSIVKSSEPQLSSTGIKECRQNKLWKQIKKEAKNLLQAELGDHMLYRREAYQYTRKNGRIMIQELMDGGISRPAAINSITALLTEKLKTEWDRTNKIIESAEVEDPTCSTSSRHDAEVAYKKITEEIECERMILSSKISKIVGAAVQTVTETIMTRTSIPWLAKETAVNKLKLKIQQSASELTPLTLEEVQQAVIDVTSPHIRAGL
jgi:uncharacterized protein YoaH (UPF0181 family)